MTIDEMRASREAFLTPSDIADVLGSNPQAIREQARSDPKLLGFNVIVIGTRTKIPRIPFLKFIGEETT